MCGYGFPFMPICDAVHHFVFVSHSSTVTLTGFWPLSFVLTDWKKTIFILIWYWFDSKSERISALNSYWYTGEFYPNPSFVHCVGFLFDRFFKHCVNTGKWLRGEKKRHPFDGVPLPLVQCFTADGLHLCIAHFLVKHCANLQFFQVV